MEELKSITLYDEEGNEVLCDVLMTYLCEKNETNYVFYTDNSKDEDGNLNLYASRYIGVEDGNVQLEDIESEEEWSLLDEVLEEAKKGLEE